jgi:hypothetical protein
MSEHRENIPPAGAAYGAALQIFLGAGQFPYPEH